MTTAVTSWCSRRPAAAAAWGLVLLALASQWRAFLPGRVLSPADALYAAFPWKALRPGVVAMNPVLADVTFQIHPRLLHVADEVGHGRFPLWTPDIFAGAPLFANPNSAVLFPLNALAYALPFGLALALAAVLKLATAGLGTFWLLRLFGVGTLGAFTGGAAFMLNATLVVWLQNTVGSAVALLPLLVALVEQVRRTPGGVPVTALAGAVALMVFAGYPPVALLGTLAAALWALARARGAPAGGRFLLRVLGGMALGAALAAVQLVPFVEYMRESAIYAYRLEWKPVLTLPRRAAIVFLMPQYYGGPEGFWGPWNFNEVSTSAGLLPWLALPAALVGAWGRPGTRCFAGLGALAAAVLYGVPGLGPALAELPLVSLAMSLRVAPLLVLALCALGAIGVDVITRGGAGAGRAERWAMAIWFAALAGLALASVLDDHATSVRAALGAPLALQYLAFLGLSTGLALLLLRMPDRADRRAAWTAGLVALQLASTLPLAIGYNPVTQARWLYPSTPAIEHVRQASAADPGRVLLQANLGMLYGLADPSGYDGMTPRRFEQVVRPGGGLTLLGNGSLTVADLWASPVLDLVGVRRALVPPGVTVAGPGWAIEYDGADARVYRNGGALPRAFVAPEGRCVDDASALGLIAARAVDFRREVLLAGCSPAAASMPRAAAFSAAIRQAEPSRVLIAAASDAPAFLVLTDTWYPGWRVSVDGAEQPLLRANHAFRGVRIGAGSHEVVFEYRPASFRIGVLVSLAAMAGGTVLLMRGRRRSGAPEPRASMPPAGRRVRALLWLLLAALGALALVLGWRTSTLPPSPFSLDVVPSTVREGEPAVIRISPRGGAPPGTSRPVDLYLASLQGWESAVFLTPEGAWSARPVPYRRASSLAGVAPVEAPWPWERTVGSVRLALIVVEASADPRSRVRWLFQPALATVTLRAAITEDLGRARALATLGGLVLVTVASVLGVAHAARRRALPARLPGRCE